MPTVLQWRSVFEEVRHHALFRELDVRYAKAPAQNVGYTPVGIVASKDISCTVVIAEGDNPKMQTLMQFSSTAQELHNLLLLAAAHELGHCLRVRNRQLSPQFWALVASTEEGTAQRHFMERQASLEEAYADAYALVYMRDSHAAQYEQALLLMTALRADPDFETPFYQVLPLYKQLAQRGLDTTLPLQRQVDLIVWQSKFPAN